MLGEAEPPELLEFLPVLLGVPSLQGSLPRPLLMFVYAAGNLGDE